MVLLFGLLRGKTVLFFDLFNVSQTPWKPPFVLIPYDNLGAWVRTRQ